MNHEEIIYLVDDEKGMLKALGRLLNAEGYHVELFENGAVFLATPRPPAVECVILDVAMTAVDGLTIQLRLAEAGDLIPIIFLTGHGDIPMSVRAVKSGAVDFLTKPVNDEDLLRAVRLALEVSHQRRDTLLSEADLLERFARLTPRERQVMEQVVTGKLNKQIAAQLGTGEQTIKIHRMRVMDKMGIRSVAELVRAADRLSKLRLPD